MKAIDVSLVRADACWIDGRVKCCVSVNDGVWADDLNLALEWDDVRRLLLLSISLLAVYDEDRGARKLIDLFSSKEWYDQEPGDGWL